MTTQPRHLSADDHSGQPEDSFSFQPMLDSSTERPERPERPDASKPSPLMRHPDVQSSKPITEGSRLQWFYDMPVRRKQLTGLITSEVISVVGLVGVGSFLIVAGGRAQLLQQAKSELSVTDLAYNIKVNQMGYGFRGQSDNAAIIAAAREAASGRLPAPETIDPVERILKNEVTAREIEYATLVGRDLRIIAGANADRRGERFDPGGLVGTVLANPRQIKTNAIVSWEELQREAPPLPEGLTEQDALIRYVLTPVKDPTTQEVLGVLVAGDIVNNKLPIVQGTVEAFDNGYSAVYTRQPDGTFQLATALQLPDNSPIEAARPAIPLSDTNILEWATQQSNGPVTRRMQIGDQTYTVAAQAVYDFNNQPVGVLVRGTSEVALNQLLRNSLLLQLVIAALALAADIVLAGLLGRAVANPIEELRRANRRFAEGDRSARAKLFAKDEIGQLVGTFNQLADTVVRSEAVLEEQFHRQEASARRSQLLAELTSRIRQSLDFDEILKTSVTGVREVLKVDRVLIYRFNPDLKSGVIVAESVGRGWLKALGQTIHDPLVPGAIERFKSGRISTIDDLATAELSECHCEILRRLEVRANMVAPIVIGDDLIGLLCAHQCSGPKHWEEEELDLIQQISTQVGYALAQATVLRQQEETAEREQQLTKIILHMWESLERETIFQTVVHDTRAVLKTDRLLVFLFDEKWEGTVVAESVEPGYPAAMGAQIADPCFTEKYIEQYRQGRVKATDNLQEAGLTQCHLKLLAPFQVKANLVAPIKVDDRLLGLLIAHQCSGPRHWQDGEIKFFRQLAAQLGFALEQAELFAELEQARLKAEKLSEERRLQKEALQLQLLDLLSQVEGAARGDLTVRADVTDGEIGTVADFFNSIVESLRQIVTQVKQSVVQVNASLGENEAAIQRLAEQALQQADETTRTLSSIEMMTRSIQVMAENAQQAAKVAKSASTTAEMGGSAMDLTVQNILSLRETVGETAKKVKRLGESSQQISKVVSLINQIAMQTNLLAINAGIEAARAGEEGQGFAVVAEEVGELAARSAAATQEIERIVDNIQRETSQVVEAMEQSTAQVVEGTHLVEDAKQSLQQILDVSQQIDQLVQSISEATVSQVSTSEVVSKLMKEIALVSEQTSQSSHQVSSALRRTVEVAQTLQASVGAFEVGADI
ncbi:GAF domain-containing protein [Thermocoleostomius sinensis]|uniref:Methyl-accepting chemotaxis protein n=1 Tax=Thermocoleostomius sinensis A174 TaxID=2016057 RepID=A0A9E8ZEQ8_9CYAN|nr:GAF domain-containing protein [Thermocoleostomius sinensis]WAL60462.1 methyl-accepting chemotaxis protein [Thermocoleostomius sinensis A174]